MKKKRTKKKFSMSMKSTLAFIMFMLSACMIGMLVRVYYVAEVKGEQYARRVLSQQSYVSNPILYRRGEITDRNGTSLAVNVKVYNLVVSPKTILNDAENKEFTLQTIADVFQLDRAQIEKDITDYLAVHPESQYFILKKDMFEDEIAPFKEIEEQAKEKYRKKKKDETVNLITGTWFEEKYKRRYPLGTTACDIIGFAAGEKGAMGIEAYYNDELTGSYGREYGYYNSELELQRTVKPAVDGNTVISSIDANVQAIVEKKIKKLSKDMGASNIAVIMMDPNNGEIIAMASDKVYDLNNPENLEAYYTKEEIAALGASEKDEKKNELWKNFCISGTYEPGSTFKTFTVAAALDEKAADPNTTYVCEGEMQVSDRTIGCANRVQHGTVTPREALMESCNCALMRMSFSLGADEFYKYVNQIYGFGNKTGIDLIGEERGITHNRDKIGIVELATSCFGQTQNVTMVQMASAFCSLINGGYYYEPHVVKEIRTTGGSLVYKNRGNLVRQTVTSQTSDYIRNWLFDTVKEGTAKPAAIEGYDIGGKTGTGETRNHDGSGETSERDYIVSFMGFAPVEDPQIVIYVLIDRPQVEDQAHSTYATEFAHDIMKETFPFLGIYNSKAGSEAGADDNNDTSGAGADDNNDESLADANDGSDGDDEN